MAKMFADGTFADGMFADGMFDMSDSTSVLAPLSVLMVDDFDVFLDTNEFAEQAIIVATNAPITIIIDAPVEPEKLGGIETELEEIRALAKSTDVAALARGDLLEFRGEQYRLKRQPEREGDGFSKIQLVIDQVTDPASGAWR